MTDDPAVRTLVARRRFAEARFARLATVSDAGPHLVPVVFAMVGEQVVTAVDGKPKSTTKLRRLAHIAAHPQVSLLVDHADEDWSTLWWVRLDGTAAVHEIDTPLGRDAVVALRAKYPQYGRVALPGPVIVVTPTRWVTWSASGT